MKPALFFPCCSRLFLSAECEETAFTSGFCPKSALSDPATAHPNPPKVSDYFVLVRGFRRRRKPCYTTHDTSTHAHTGGLFIQFQPVTQGLGLALMAKQTSPLLLTSAWLPSGSCSSRTSLDPQTRRDLGPPGNRCNNR